MFGPATKEGATRGQPVINKWRDPVPIKGADLYLINPSGIVFGQNATINVSGSFHASTADYLKNVGRRAVPGNQSQRQHIENSTTGGVWDSASSNESASASDSLFDVLDHHRRRQSRYLRRRSLDSVTQRETC